MGDTVKEFCNFLCTNEILIPQQVIEFTSKLESMGGSVTDDSNHYSFDLHSSITEALSAYLSTLTVPDFQALSHRLFFKWQNQELQQSRTAIQNLQRIRSKMNLQSLAKSFYKWLSLGSQMRVKLVNEVENTELEPMSIPDEFSDVSSDTEVKETEGAHIHNLIQGPELTNRQQLVSTYSSEVFLSRRTMDENTEFLPDPSFQLSSYRNELQASFDNDKLGEQKKEKQYSLLSKVAINSQTQVLPNPQQEKWKFPSSKNNEFLGALEKLNQDKLPNEEEIEVEKEKVQEKENKKEKLENPSNNYVKENVFQRLYSNALKTESKRENPLQTPKSKTPNIPKSKSTEKIGVRNLNKVVTPNELQNSKRNLQSQRVKLKNLKKERIFHSHKAFGVTPTTQILEGVDLNRIDSLKEKLQNILQKAQLLKAQRNDQESTLINQEESKDSICPQNIKFNKKRSKEWNDPEPKIMKYKNMISKNTLENNNELAGQIQINIPKELFQIRADILTQSKPISPLNLPYHPTSSTHKPSYKQPSPSFRVIKNKEQFAHVHKNLANNAQNIYEFLKQSIAYKRPTENDESSQNYLKNRERINSEKESSVLTTERPKEMIPKNVTSISALTSPKYDKSPPILSLDDYYKQIINAHEMS